MRGIRFNHFTFSFLSPLVGFHYGRNPVSGHRFLHVAPIPFFGIDFYWPDERQEPAFERVFKDTEQTWNCGNDCTTVVNSISDDGSFGGNEGGDNGIFFFTQTGTMVETVLDWLYSDKPLAVDVPELVKKKGNIMKRILILSVVTVLGLSSPALAANVNLGAAQQRTMSRMKADVRAWIPIYRATGPRAGSWTVQPCTAEAGGQVADCSFRMTFRRGSRVIVSCSGVSKINADLSYVRPLSIACVA